MERDGGRINAPVISVGGFSREGGKCEFFCQSNCNLFQLAAERQAKQSGKSVEEVNSLAIAIHHENSPMAIIC